MADYFADVIGNITVTGNLVRIDFLSQSSPVLQQQAAQLQVAHRLVMPLDGFLRSLDTQERVRAKLIADGVVKINKDEAVESAELEKKGSVAE